MTLETAFTLETSTIKYGPEVTRELGCDMARLGARRVMVVTDPNLGDGQAVSTAMEALASEGIDAVLFDRARVEPTDESFKDAARFALDGGFDGYVAVGGGSSIDTAKAANLYATYPDDFLAYVNPPIGHGKPVPGPLKPLIAVPTTAGTGSETTGIAIFDLLEMRAKTGISHRALRPSMGIVDPDNTRTLPAMVAACSGFDVLSHALESYTALPFHQRLAAESPAMRPAYQGSNPISDVWARRSIEIVSQSMVRAVEDPLDHDARAQMLLAATFAGIGFGNAGCHLPHGMSYPVSGMVREFVADDYPPERPIVPHGMSVILNAPAVFRFTGSTDPERHLEAAALMGVDISDARLEDAGDILADAIVELIRRLRLPNGLSAVGYSDSDVDGLVAGTLPQHRVTRLCPRAFGEAELRQLFIDSMTLW